MYIIDPRTAIILDTSYLYHGAKTIENDAKLDYSKLIEVFQVMSIHCTRIIAFVLDTSDNEDNMAFKSFVQKLESLDMDVIISKPKNGKTDSNVAIAVEALSLADKVDCIVLGSGDGSFVPLVNKLKATGIRTVILAYSRSASDNLLDIADEFIEITPNLFMTSS